MSIHQRLYFWVENFIENLYNQSCIGSIWLYIQGADKSWKSLFSVLSFHLRSYIHVSEILQIVDNRESPAPILHIPNRNNGMME